MIDKFIEMVEHQAAAFALQCDIENDSKYEICSIDRIQLMDSAQALFDGFCERFNLTPRVSVDRTDSPPTRTQRVRYKDITIMVYGDDVNG